MDKFYIELGVGENTVLRHSSLSSVTIPDIPSFDAMKERTNQAVADGSDITGLERFERNCGIPDRLLLPKGKENGLEMVLMAFLEDGVADAADGFTPDPKNEFGGTHAHCGIRGEKIPDKRAMGYPLDRQIFDFRMTAAIPNFKTSLVFVFHKSDENNPRATGYRPRERMGAVGGVGAVRESDAKTQELLLGVKGDVEKRLGRELEVFEVVSYSTQTVAGLNYFAKVRIGEGQYIHIRVYKHFSGTLAVHGVLDEMTVDAPIEYIDMN